MVCGARLSGVVCSLPLLVRVAGVIRGPIMMFYRHPAMFTLPVIALLGGMLLHAMIKMMFGDRYKKQPEKVKKYDHYYGDSYKFDTAPADHGRSRHRLRVRRDRLLRRRDLDGGLDR